ncbi:MAG: UDP-N-acetylmuramoylalanine--D-glutamate ligase [Candidatus Jacksonbacteria bacterium RIFCSPLOWO2_02_FULL_43_9]|uniref:UDP-N-acetylmuramoylalanine--D-glutamate ligase n=1 Tax=Candidatus Falkowbacteria bacterium GW2011_GWA2_41_14 TaxID=1618635 RepID=A0A0G0UVK8_9BACT|nr:MAG: UDP-N-acetylmuramoylalanine-D-glutamate ligase [Candidatus Falkowbacteria bacterium GW2011_GWA2_41_14]OGY71794.1 MAG: UDP-N-acetylmuramoylalanine--D-glutamate ligase [Candidatus Jacksonbacteria bacterium RIFCSPLOWO2_02_FULL_43_9]HAZ16854.1 UDP-N-acetylmuramoyl-L-alanine--D-glutamate ligase [Candidatus Jacksonbacteria bacterium]
MLDFRGKKIVIMGLGVNGGGLGSARYFAVHGAKVLVTDTRTKQELSPSLAQLQRYKNIQYVLGGHREQDFVKADMIIKNPAVRDGSKYISIARKNHIPVETDMSIFMHLCPAPIIGVTGTKGKTTTATFISALLKAWDSRTIIAGNMRISPLDFLDSLLKKKGEYPWVVLELSSWHLDGVAHVGTSPKVAVITNIFEDHLDRYASFEDYVASKRLIIHSQAPDDIAVLNADNDITQSFASLSRGSVVWFSAHRLVQNQQGIFIHKGMIVERKKIQKKTVEKEIMPVRALPFPGDHIIADACAAIAVARVVGVPRALIKKVLKKASLPEGRMQVIAEKGGVCFMNDTTATVPGAALATLMSSDLKKKKGDIILICGGVSKNVQYTLYADAISRSCKAVILLSTGERETASEQLKKELSEISFHPIISAPSMDDAVRIACEYAIAGDCVLLSPAAASFGMFQNEFDRGDQFNVSIKKYCGEKTKK